MRKIIDAHCHIYPDKIAERATAATGDFYSIPFACDGKVSTLKKEDERAGITHCIVQSVATAPKQVSSINHFIADSCGENENLTGLGTLHPDSDDQERDIKELISLGLKGVKLHPDIQKFKIDDYRCLKIYELCEKNNLPILMHTGDSRYDYSNPNRLILILEIYDKLTIIGAHFGGWSIWKDAAKRLNGFKGLFVDSSSALYALKRGEAEEIIKLYGAERVLFGTDFPMWSPKEELDRFMALDLKEADRENILWENSARLFDINI